MQFSERFQKIINLELRAEDTIVSTTVRIVTSLTAMVTADTTEEKIRADIKDTLAKFVPGAEWQINNLNRTRDASGFEKITLNAATRVSERENFNLDERAKQASRQGLQITSAVADTSIPTKVLEAKERELRLAILAKAKEEAKQVNELLGEGFYVGSVQFDNNGAAYNRVSNVKAMTMSAAPAGYGSGFASGGAATDDSLSNAQKLVLTAQVSLIAGILRDV